MSAMLKVFRISDQLHNSSFFLFNEAQTRISMLIDNVDKYINIVHYSAIL